MLGALIGAGGSLLGGLFGSRSERRAIAAQNAYNDPSAVRARFEAAGFNPLLGIQPGVGMQSTVGGTNFFGAAIADAALQVGSNVTARADAARASALATQNQRLTDQVKNLTIRPKVGGIYARRESVPALPGGSDAGNTKTSAASPPLAVGPNSASVPVPDARLDSGTGYYVAGNYVSPRPGYSSAQVYEDNYGEGVGEIRGLENYVSELIPATRRWMDLRGITSPGTDYWAKGYHAAKGMVPKIPAPSRNPPKKKPSFWDSYRPGGF